jgi:hypothetical protein
VQTECLLRGRVQAAAANSSKEDELALHRRVVDLEQEGWLRRRAIGDFDPGVRRRREGVVDPEVELDAVDKRPALALDDMKDGRRRASPRLQRFARPQHERREPQHRHAVVSSLGIDISELNRVAAIDDRREVVERRARVVPRESLQRIAVARAVQRTEGREARSAIGGLRRVGLVAHDLWLSLDAVGRLEVEEGRQIERVHPDHRL